jgi:hypothetical protein
VYGPPMDQHQPTSAIPTIDPSKNVLETMDRLDRRQDDLRIAQGALQDAKREGAIGRLEQRLNDDRYYGERIARMLERSVVDTSALLSKQVEQNNTGLNVRVTELEKNRYETGGKSAGVSSSIAMLVAVGMVGAGLASAVFTIIGALSRVAT